MAKLNKEQRKARDEIRFRERVEQRRENCEDVVAYAIANGRAYKFLTNDEKEELRTRRAERNARLDAKMDLDLDISGVMLLALKDNEDPDGPEAQAAIRKLKSDFKKAFPA